MTEKKPLTEEELTRELRDTLPDGWRWFAARNQLIEHLVKEKTLSFEATAHPENAYLGFQTLDRLERNVGYLNEAWRRKATCTLRLSKANNTTHILHFTL